MNRIATGAVRTFGIVSVLLLAGLGTPSPAGGNSARVKKDLTATSMAPEARGKARLTLRSSKHGKFSVLAKHLAGGQHFDVVVGGVKVGSLTTNSGGSGKARFSTQPRSKDTLLGFDPRGARIIVRDEDGDDVLEGEMPDDDGTETACCNAENEDEEGEVECEEKTPEECTAEGGTPIGVPGGTAASCIPNPCSTTPPPGGVVCCTNETHDDESEAECDVVATAAECAEDDGSVVQAGSCDPNPCQPAPPTNRTACCVPEDDDEPGEAECEVLSAEACTAAGGSAISAATCEPDPCESGDDDGDGEADGD